MPTRKPYASTAVPAERSMGAILALLRARKIDSRWTSMVGPPERVHLQMIWQHEGIEIRARIEVPIVVRPKPVKPGRGPRRAAMVRALTDKQAEKALADERKRVLRMLAWWLKVQFEAVDAGLLTEAEVMLPFLEVGSTNTTVAQAIIPRLAALRAGGGGLARALTGPEK